MTKLSLAISHTPWVPERVVTLARLKAQLGIADAALHKPFMPPYGPADEDYLEVTERAKNYEWSNRMWHWAAERDVTHCLFLQDDVIVPSNFWPALKAMLEAVPNQVIALESAHPGGRIAWRRNEHWMTTSDGLIGVGYIFPRDLLKEFLAWRETALQDGVLERINEDSLIDLWLMDTGRLAYHPVPTIIDHDTEVPSTYGNDHHTHRRPSVTWADLIADGKDPDVMTLKTFWMTKVPHLGRFYAEAYRNLMALKEFNRERFLTLERDFCPKAYLATPANKAGLKIVIATPVMSGDVSLLYTSSIYRLGSTVKDAEFSLLAEYNAAGQKVHLGHMIDHTWFYSRDLVRARSRQVRRFLRTDGTHMLFIDADIAFTIEAIAGLVAAGEDFVAAPYPRKDIDWNRVRKAASLGLDPEKYAHTYAFRKLTDTTWNGETTIEVAGIGFGCCLISRKCLQRMVDYYGEDITDEILIDKVRERSPTLDAKTIMEVVTILEDAGFIRRDTLKFRDDLPSEGFEETVALFQLMIDNTNLLLGEDYSFCDRWRAIGGKIKMYVGRGSPVTHVGGYTFQGSVDGLRALDAAPTVDQ